MKVVGKIFVSFLLRLEKMFTTVTQRKPPLNSDVRIQKQDGRDSRVQGTSRVQKGKGALFFSETKCENINTFRDR